MKKRILAMFILLSTVFLWSFPFCAKEHELQKEVEYVQENTSTTVREVKEIEEIVVKDEYEIAIEEAYKEIDGINNIEDKKEWFVEYKKILEKYSYIIDPPESIYDIYSEEEIYIMQRCIETETHDCDFLSKVNVANVILNRVEHESFPDEPTDVVTAANQFAYGRENIAEDTVLALEYAFMMPDTTDEALYFHSSNKTNTFNKKSYKFTDDAGHHFY